MRLAIAFFISLAIIVACLAQGGRAYLPATLIVNPTRIQGNSHLNGSGAATNTIVVTLSAPVMTGGLVVVVATFPDAGTDNVTAVTDDKGNTYTLAPAKVNNAGAAFSSRGAYAVNVTNGPTTITATVSGAAKQFMAITADEFAGVVTTSPADGTFTGQAQTGPGTGANAVTSTNMTTSVIGDLIYGFGVSLNSNTLNVGLGFTGAIAASTTYFTEWSWQQPPPGATAATWTATNGGDSTITIVMAFRTLAGAPPPPTTNIACSGNITSALVTALTTQIGGIINIGAGSCSVGDLGQVSDMCANSCTIAGTGIASTNLTLLGNAGTQADCKFLQPYTTGTKVPKWRITGIHFVSTCNTQTPIWVWAWEDNSFRGGWRIDHNSFDMPNSGACIYVYGPTYGLIDHNQFNWGFESCILAGLVTSAEDAAQGGGSPTINTVRGAAAAAQAFTPGGANMLYIEDNTFGPVAGCLIGGGCAPIDTPYSGMRTVFRHNTVNNAYLFNHWTSQGNWNASWLEIYANNFIWTSNAFEAMRCEGGCTGLVFENTITGLAGTNNAIWIGEQRLTAATTGVNGPPMQYCSTTASTINGPQTWDGALGDASADGWPCISQTGRAAGVSIAALIAGSKQASYPMYLWSNGPESTCQSGGACSNTFTIFVSGGPTAYFKNTAHTVTGGGNGQGDVDWCVNTSQPSGCGTHTLTYTRYTYPHPWPF